MNLLLSKSHIVLIIFVTFVISFFLVPVFKRVAFHIGAYDEPNKRRLNKVAMPTIGGLAVFFSFLFGYMIFGRASIEMISILIGSFIIILTGLIDDINPIKAKYQVIGQLLAILVIVVYGNVTIDVVTLFGHTLNFAFPLNYIITIIFMLGIINAIDLSDGMDGLCGGISIIYFLTILVIAYLLNMAGGIDTTISLLMIGSILGFLAWNFPPAKIYLGDTGSNFIGLIIATSAIYGFKLATFTSLLIPLLVLGAPIIDVLFSIIRRTIQGKNPFTTPDKKHFHHQLLNMKFSTRSSILIIYFISLLFSAVSVLYAIGNIKYALILYFTLLVVFLFMAFNTSIIFPGRGKSDEDDQDKLS